MMKVVGSSSSSRVVAAVHTLVISLSLTEYSYARRPAFVVKSPLIHPRNKLRNDASPLLHFVPRGGSSYNYNEEQRDGFYDEDYAAPQKRERSQRRNILVTGDRRYGMMLTAGGGLLMFLGITLFFNKLLIRWGNMMILAGVPLLVGPTRAARYFANPAKIRATGCVAAGVFLVVMAGWPILGLLLQAFGIMNLFGNMFPMVWAIGKQMPVVGKIIKAMETPTRKDKGEQRNRYDPDDDDQYRSSDQQESNQQQWDSGNSYGQQQPNDSYGNSWSKEEDRGSYY